VARERGGRPLNALSERRLAIVIPAYEAADMLPKVLARIPSAIRLAARAILVVEDCGPAGPLSTTPALRAEYPTLEVLQHDRNRGYGAAQKTGYRRALELGCDLVVLLHADGQYAPELMERLLAPLLRGEADIVLGSRMLRKREALRGGMPLYKFLGNLFFTLIENLAYGMRLSEYHSGYIAYSREALRRIPFERLTDAFHFDGQMLMLGGKRGLRIAEVPIATHYGDEISHLRAFRYGLEVFETILSYWAGRFDSEAPET